MTHPTITKTTTQLVPSDIWISPPEATRHIILRVWPLTNGYGYRVQYCSAREVDGVDVVSKEFRQNDEFLIEVREAEQPAPGERVIMAKRADQIRVGDILPENAAYRQRIVTDIGPSRVHESWVMIETYSDNHCDELSYEPSKMLEVETTAPALTPAQQHVDELIELARHVANGAAHGHVMQIAVDLLDKIDPPPMPTLAETLAALADLAEGHSVTGKKKAEILLSRARRAGVIK